MPPASTPHGVVGSALAKPQAGRWKPSLFPFPLAGNTPSSSAYRPHGKAGSLSCHLLTPSSPFLICLPYPLLPPHQLPPPKALGFSVFKCGLKIIFGKLTALSLPFLPTSKRKEHLEAFGATS